MTCAGCVASVEKVLRAQAGVNEVNVNLATNTAMVAYDEGAVNEAALKGAVQAAGYDLLIDEAEASATEAEQRQRDQLVALK